MKDMMFLIVMMILSWSLGSVCSQMGTAYYILEVTQEDVYKRQALVIAFGFPRYPKPTIVATRFLKNRGYKIVSITDKKKSPLAELSEYAFRLQANSYGYTDTYTSGILLINLITALIGKIQGTDINRHLREFNETAQQLDFYF